MTEQIQVPDSDAGELAVITFAGTYNGYELHGGVLPLGDLTRRIREHWQRTGELDESVDVLRACLFFEVRAHRHGGGYGRFDEEPFRAALVERIRTLSGGSVPLRSSAP